TLRILLTTVFTLTGWHYVKQSFGVGMLAARSGGLRPTRREALVLRYGLYPVWLYDVLEIYGHGRAASYQRYDVTLAVVPQALDPWLRGIGVGALVVTLGLMVRIGVRARRVPPLGLWGVYLAGGLWFLAPPSYVSAAVVLAGLHAVQYLACSHRAEVDLAVERREPHLVHRWLCVFGGAAAGGLLLTHWLPDVAATSVATPGVPAMIPALVFVVFNLHHYAVDAVIWRSGGEHVVRMSRGPQSGPVPLAAAASPSPVPVPVSGAALA
ncbi:MAG: putative rane protein, partial [Acidimicrobiales bacterium]|nr:putative rane protein [Acidimicrobiales bacterium]